MRKLFVFGYFTSAFVLIIPLFAIAFKTTIFHYLVTQNVKLVPGNFIYDVWLNLPIDLRMNFYLFNLVNPNEFLLGSKPVFEEVGPFVYDEKRIKENVTFNNGTISYRERRRFYFNHELSVSSDDVYVTSINMVIITYLNLVKNAPFLNSKMIQEAVELLFKANRESMLIKKPARELLFGYEDDLLAILVRFNLISSAQISFFLNKNDTLDGTYTIFDGVDDPYKIGQIKTYNGMNNLPYWVSEYANEINGTDFTVNFPFLNKSSTPYTYQPDTCRSFYTVYNETSKSFRGIETYGYILDEALWANASLNPSNQGFCAPNCLVSGVFNLSQCVKMGPLEVPTYLSMPHFLFGDEQLLKDNIGLSPDFEKHKTIIYFEPLTGVPLQANKRVQLNTRIIKDENFPMSQNLPEIYFPLFWLDENFVVSDELGNSFYKMVQLPTILYDVLSYILIAIGAIIGTFTIFFSCYRRDTSLTVYAYEPIGGEDVEDESNEQIVNNITAANTVII